MKLTLPARAPVPAFRDEVDRLFDFMKGVPFAAPLRPVETVWTPPLDFAETEKEFVVKLEVPGIAKEDLEVEVEGRVLMLTGRRDLTHEGKGVDYFWREREQGRFVRTIDLPAAVDPAGVTATCLEGVMTVRLPKAEPKIKNRIAVK
jgi:HSP20 family protein